MGVRERRERERKVLRQAILDAAREIAAAEGWPAVTIRRVAEKIEYSPPVIYEHFHSKEQIVVEMLREGFREMLAQMRAALAAHSDPIEGMLALGRAYWEFAVAHPEMHVGMHGETAFEACAAGTRIAVPQDGPATPAGGVRHRPFEEVHDTEEWHAFFRSRNAPPSEYEPFPETREIFITVRDAIERALGERAGDLESLSWKVVTLWGSTVGLITLAMAGMIPHGRDVGAQLIEKMIRDLLVVWRAEEAPWRPKTASREKRVARARGGRV